jgi:hypothetical protein
MKPLIWPIIKIGILTAAFMWLFGDSFRAALMFSTLIGVLIDFLPQMNLLLRLRCWKHGVCYKHRRAKTRGGLSGNYLWCDDCDKQRIEREQNKIAYLIKQSNEKQK